MIIGINGKIGSGKDTVGKIIQWLTKPELDGSYIGFQTYDDITLDRVSDWKIKKFAGKLKEIASLLTGIDVEKFEDQDFKKTNLEKNWDVKSKYRDRRPPKPMTVREFLQKLGTEAMRDGLHTNVWVNALFADYKHSKTCNCKKGCRCAHDLPNWIITDMRFPNEMEAVVEKGGITIRVVRPGTVTGEHPSEIALDGHTMHYEIINDGTIEDLVEKVREILIERNII
jgi:hypothetical protein